MGVPRSGQCATGRRRAALVTLLAGVAALHPAPAAAQALPGGAPVGPVPSLGAHRFSPTGLVRGPFIRTSFRSQLGVGGSGGMELGTIAIGDTTIHVKSGEMLYTDLMLEYQHAVKDWLGVSLRVGGVGRLGTETSSLLAEGVTVASNFHVGWLARLWRSQDMMLSGGLRVDSQSFTVVDLSGFIERILEDGGIEPGNSLVQSVPVLVTIGELRYAYGMNDIVGLLAEGNLGYGESFSREASSQWYYVLGAAVDIDLNPRTSVPVGLELGARLYNIPMGDPNLDGNGESLVLRISHTGTPDLSLGISIESRWLHLVQVEGTLRYTSATLDFEYFF